MGSTLKSKPRDKAETFAEEYCELLSLNIGPITRNDIIRAFVTGFKVGEMSQSNKDLLELVQYEPDGEDA
jgi:hypothetical protein